MKVSENPAINQTMGNKRVMEAYLFNDIKQRGLHYLAYEKTYDFGNQKVHRVFENGEIKELILPRHVEKFMEELKAIGDSEKFGKYSIYSMDVQIDEATRVPRLIVNGVLEEVNEDRCEAKWKEFKTTMLLPLEQRYGVRYAEAAIRASYGQGRPLTRSCDFNL